MPVIKWQQHTNATTNEKIVSREKMIEYFEYTNKVMCSLEEFTQKEVNEPVPIYTGFCLIINIIRPKSQLPERHSEF